MSATCFTAGLEKAKENEKLQLYRSIKKTLHSAPHTYTKKKKKIVGGTRVERALFLQPKVKHGTDYQTQYSEELHLFQTF